MSEAKNALTTIKNFTSNLSKNKGKIIIGSGLTAIALIVGYNVLVSNAELKISEEVLQEAQKQSIRDTGKKTGPSGEMKIEYQKDESGVNDANARLNELEEKSYQNRVYDAANDDKSEIIARDTNNGNAKIRFKSDNKINKLEREKVIQEVNVPDLAAKTIVVPPKMTFNNEVKDENQKVTTYLNEDNTKVYLANEEMIIASNIQGQFSKIISEKDKDMKNNDVNEYKFNQTEFYTNRYEQHKLNVENDKNIAQLQREKMKDLASSNQIAQKAGAYSPSDTVVKTSLTSTDQTMNDVVLFQQGEIVSAITLMGSSNLNLGPIKAQITEGEYAGAILNGTASQGAERLLFTFSSMYLPNDPTLIAINAIALKHDTLESGTYTNIDRRAFMNYLVKPTLKAGAAIGEYYANNAGTTTTTSSGLIVQSNAQKSIADAKKVGLGAAMDAISNDIDNIDTSTIVTQDQFTPIKIYFTEEVVYKKSKQTPSLSRDNATNQYVKPLDEPQYQQAIPLQQQIQLQQTMPTVTQ